MSGRHDYHSCRDPECPRPWCRIWKEAYEAGYGDGFTDGARLAQSQGG